MARISSSELNAVIKDPNSTMILVEKANELGKDLAAKRLTTNQIRALFGEVRHIQGQLSKGQLSTGDQTRALPRALRKLILLKPKMAYRARRERGRGVEELARVLDPAIDIVVNEPNEEAQRQHFQRFVDFFEAILAYHKSHGGS